MMVAVVGLTMASCGGDDTTNNTSNADTTHATEGGTITGSTGTPMEEESDYGGADYAGPGSDTFPPETTAAPESGTDSGGTDSGGTDSGSDSTDSGSGSDSSGTDTGASTNGTDSGGVDYAGPGVQYWK